MTTCYQFGGPFVDLFDQHFHDLTGSAFENDIAFYCGLAKRTGGPVLELGSGTGRVALPIAAERIDVHGIELSPAMLALSRAKAAGIPHPPEFQLGDMSNFEIQRKFKLIIAAFGAFHHLETTRAQLDCLSCIRQHLLPDGTAVIHLRNPPVGSLADMRFQQPRILEGIEPSTGFRVVSESKLQTVDPLHQTITELWQHRKYDTSGKLAACHEDTFVLRWTYLFEMEHLLVRSGFGSIMCFGDFFYGSVKDECQHIWLFKPEF